MNALLDAALDYAARGWPVLPCRPQSKQPWTRHSFKEASCDERALLHLFDARPGANVAVATGAPGPTIGDVDDVAAAGDIIARLHALDGPVQATARGLQFLFAGTDRGTISLGFGELRSRGSYCVLPPSIHPSGRVYTWVRDPRDWPLPPVPSWLLDGRESAGCGDQRVHLNSLIPHGARHAHLTDAAVRFARGGFRDERLIARLLATVFEIECDPLPPPRADEFTDLAKWAVGSQIAQRERDLAEREHELRAPPDRWWVRT